MNKPDWIPARVVKHRGKWTYRPPKSNRRIILATIDSSKQEVMQAYNRVLNELAQADRNDVRAMINGYLESRLFTKLAARTQKDYRNMAERWQIIIGDALPDQITPPLIVNLHEQMTKKRGEVTADRHLSVLSRAFTWGRQRGWVSNDPTKQLYIKNGTGQRDRYITDTEFLLVRQFASDQLKSIMDISYLCAARLEDVIKLKHEQILEEGIYIEQGKTGVKQINEWSTALREAILRVKTDTQSILYVFHQADGSKWAKRTVQSWYTKAKNRAAEHAEAEGLPFVNDFTFHDIKAKGISDFEGDKQAFSGHKTARQVQLYDRKIRHTATVSELPAQKGASRPKK